MKNCAYCGRENPDDAKFCLECGKEFVEEEAPVEDLGDAVTVSTVFDSASAELTRARLEAAGFHAIVTNELAAMYCGSPLGSGGIHVQVPESEAAEAKEFLNAPAEPSE